MDQTGQTYFEDEDRIPQADLDRMRDAERLEFTRRAQAEKDQRLIDELQHVLCGKPRQERTIRDPKALARIDNVGSETHGPGVPE
jgi:hypothetical protein